METKWIVRLGIFLAVVVVYSAAWSYFYSDAMNPEPPQSFPLDGKGEVLAQQHGWRYVQVNAPFLGQEYYSSGPQTRDNWNRFMDRINETVAENESLLFGTFYVKRYNLQVIEQYWFVERKNGSLAVSQLIGPASAYTMTRTDWGPFNFFSFGWRPKVIDNEIIFEKPPKETLSFELKLAGFVCFMGMVGLMFVLLVVFIVMIIIMAAWYRWQNPTEENKTDIQDKNQ